MHIALVGPVATADIQGLLDGPTHHLPAGYAGAPFMGALITALVARGHRVSAFTLSADMLLRTGQHITAQGPGLTVHYLPMRPKAWPFNGWRVGRIVDLFAFERAGLTRAIQAAQPDVVHAHWAYEFAWASLACPMW
jgi:L-malate glycosyltransferase